MRLFFAPVVMSVLALSATLSLAPLVAYSQSIEEITVTARKTEENLQEVPISVTAFTADQLQNMGVNSNEDVAYQTVNFNNVAQIGRRLDRPVIRGMSSPATFGEPNASFFVDGAYVSGSVSTLTLGPIERVEVLRGPQSTQFGRATFSGAVNYVTRRPTNEFAAETTIKAASHDSGTVAGWASGALVEDKLLFFGSASYDQYGGEWSNDLLAGSAGQTGSFQDPPQKADKSDLGGTRTQQIESKLLWLIDDTKELTLKLGYNHADDEHYPQLVVNPDELNCYVPGKDLQPGDPGYDTSPGAFCGVLKPNGRRNTLNLPDLRKGMTGNIAAAPPPGLKPNDFISQGEDVGTQQDLYNALVAYEQDISDWTLNARAAWNKNDLTTAYDLDQTPERAFLGLFQMYAEDDRKDQSFEVRMTSPGDQPLRGSMGLYYFHFKQDVRQHANVGLAMGQLTDARVNRTDNYAMFGGVEYDFTDQWSFATEVRWARDKKEIDSPISCDDPGDPNFSPDKNISDDQGKNSLTPRFTLRYFPNTDLMFYGQVAKGNKPGGYNLGFFIDGVDGCATLDQLNGSDGLAYVEEEKAWNYEVGGKTSWMDNRLVANIAFFYIDWDNQTVFETVDITRDFLFAPQAVGINAGKSEVYGMELETTFAFTDNLIGTFGYGLAHGEFEDYESGELEAATGDGDASGNKIPDSSKHNFVTSLAYNRPISSQLDWFARTDFTFESKKYTSATNFAEIDDRRRWNVRSGVEDEGWRVSVFVDNILDEQTPSAILGFPRLTETNASGVNPQGYGLTPTPGRAVGAELILRFGN